MNQPTHPSLQLTPEPVSQLIELFQSHEDKLRFPDVDASSLQVMVDEMESQVEKVDEAAALLDKAREELAEMQQRLLDNARKAHAYATIYAQNDEDMLEELDKIKMGTVQKSARKRKPRSSKNSSASSKDGTKDSQSSAKPNDEEGKEDSAE